MSLKDLVETNIGFGNESCCDDISAADLGLVKQVVSGSREEVKVVISPTEWPARIPLVGQVYIEAVPEDRGLAVALYPVYDPEKINPTVSEPNDTIIRSLAFAVRGETVYVYNGKHVTVEHVAVFGHPLDVLCQNLGIDICDLARQEDLSGVELLSPVPYEEFDRRLTALKEVLREEDCFGLKEYQVNL